MERTTAEEPRPVEVSATGDEPADDSYDHEAQSPETRPPGTPDEELALYQRPEPGDDAAGPAEDPADLPVHAEQFYLEPEDFEEAPQHPALELSTAEYALPDYEQQPPRGQLDAMFETAEWGQPRDLGHRLPRAALAVAGAALALVGLGGALLSVAAGATRPAAADAAGTATAPPPRDAGPDAPVPPPDAGPGAGVVTAARDGRTNASFALLSDANLVDVRVDDLGDDLFRVTTPDGSPVRPDAATEGDEVRLSLAHTGPQSGRVQVGVVLNARVQWTLRIAGGIETGTFDLRGGTIQAIDLTGGAGRFDLSLPRPKGTLSVRMTGGVNDFQMETDGKVPVRVTARSGAGRIILDGTTNNGVARGASFRTRGWSAESDRIDLDAVAGFGTLRVSSD